MGEGWGRGDEKHNPFRRTHSTKNVKRKYRKNLEKKSKWLYITVMEETLVTKREGAKGRNRSRSYRRYKKAEEAINKATNNGKCWWLAKYLKHTIKY